MLFWWLLDLQLIIRSNKLHIMEPRALSYYSGLTLPWWRHQMETFSALLAICAGNSPVTSEFPAQRPVTRSFDVFFDLRPNKRLSKQSWCWWFEMPSHPLWRHSNVKWAAVTWQQWEDTRTVVAAMTTRGHFPTQPSQIVCFMVTWDVEWF